MRVHSTQKRGQGGGFREGSRRRHERPRRSSWNSDSGPRLTKPSTQGGRGRQGELARTLGAAVEGPTRHAPWPAAMELAGAPRTALRSAPFREKNRRGGSGRGEEAHHGAKSQRKRLGTAAYARPTKNFRRRFSLRFHGWEQKRGGGKMGRGRLGRADSLHLKPRRGGSWRTWERGLRPGRLLLRERIRERRLEEGGGPDGWAPPVSRQREKLFLFIFQTNFPNSFPNEFLNSNSFHQNHSSHKRNAPACMQQNISLTYI
jgi:hypothetical protein